MGTGRSQTTARLVKTRRAKKRAGGDALHTRVFPRPVLVLAKKKSASPDRNEGPAKPSDSSTAKTAQWAAVVPPPANAEACSEQTTPLEPVPPPDSVDAASSNAPPHPKPLKVLADTQPWPAVVPRKNKKKNLKSFYVDARKKELAEVLPALHSSGFTIRQATLLKMLGIVVLCGIYHYTGYISGRKVARDELDADLQAMKDRAVLTDTTLRKFWLERTLWKYNKDAERIVHWMWGQRTDELDELPELPTREEYLASLEQGLQAGLITHAEFCGQLNRAAWHDWKTPDEAWKAFIDKPYRNLLPLFWFARQDHTLIGHVIDNKLPLKGLDSTASEKFLSWYLPYMDIFDQQRLARRLIEVNFDPLALMRVDRHSPVAKLYRSDQYALPGRHFYVELEKTSAVHQDGGTACPLHFSSTHYYEGRADELKGVLYIYANLDERLRPSTTLTMDVSGTLVFFQKYSRQRLRHAIRFDFSSGDVSGIVFEIERLREKEEEARLARIVSDNDPATPELASRTPGDRQLGIRVDSDVLGRLKPELVDEPVPLALDPEQRQEPSVKDALRVLKVYRE